MDQTASIALILATTRSVLLIICELAAILCIYLGWKLYIKAISSSTEGEVSGPGFKVKLASGGPGVFLCGLGVWLLLSVANRPFETTTSEAIPSAQAPSGSTQPSALAEPASAQTRTASFYLAVATQPTSAGPQKPVTKSSVCLVRHVTMRMDVGLPLTTTDVELAVKSAAAAIRLAGSAAIVDNEERNNTLKVLDQLAIDAAKSHEADGH
jgi:hypothetical protein